MIHNILQNRELSTCPFVLSLSKNSERVSKDNLAPAVRKFFLTQVWYRARAMTPAWIPADAGKTDRLQMDSEDER
jgi:hypothetical protein